MIGLRYQGESIGDVDERRGKRVKVIERCQVWDGSGFVVRSWRRGRVSYGLVY